jgi:hypothetical protein
MSSGAARALDEIGKNVAGTSSSARRSSRTGVHSGSGPSSKVRATPSVNQIAPMPPQLRGSAGRIREAVVRLPRAPCTGKSVRESRIAGRAHPVTGGLGWMLFARLTPTRYRYSPTLRFGVRQGEHRRAAAMRRAEIRDRIDRQHKRVVTGRRQQQAQSRFRPARPGSVFTRRLPPAAGKRCVTWLAAEKT